MYQRTLALILALLAAHLVWRGVGASPILSAAQPPKLASFKVVGLREAFRSGLAPEAGLGDDAAGATAPTAVALAPGLVSRAAWTLSRERTKP